MTTPKMRSHETLPGAYARALVELVGRWNVRPKELLAGLDLEAESLADPDCRVPVSQFARLVRRAKSLTGEPGLAFHMGMHLRIASHGFLGFAALAAATLGEALDLAERFVGTRTTALSLSHVIEGETAALVFEGRPSLGELEEFGILTIATTIWQIANALTGKKLTGDIECAFPEPDYIARFRHIIPGRIRFGRPKNRLIFDATVLDLPLISADPVGLQLARTQCEKELATLTDGDGLLGDVRRAIAGGRGATPRGLEEVAKKLHVGERSLKRRLRDHGTTFTHLRDQLLEERALLLLAKPTLTIEDVAASLGYSDAANFTRAFRRWTGTTPAAYRAKG